MSRLPQRGLITTLGLWVCEWLFGSNRRVKVERGQLWSDRNPAALPHYDRLFAHSRSKNFQRFHSRACECPYSHDFGQTQTISSRRNYADKYNNYSNSLLVAVQVFGSESWLCPGSVSLYQNTQWFSVKHQLQDWMDGPGRLGVSQPKPCCLHVTRQNSTALNEKWEVDLRLQIHAFTNWTILAPMYVADSHWI